MASIKAIANASATANLSAKPITNAEGLHTLNYMSKLILLLYKQIKCSVTTKTRLNLALCGFTHVTTILYGVIRNSTWSLGIGVY